MKRTILRLAVSLILFGWPIAASAAPGSIHNLRATYDNGTIAVEWDPPAAGGDQIAYYRVYYSRVSILGNQGKYDDYERTKGKEPRHTLRNFPRGGGGGTLVIAVLAVGTDGEESQVFAEEVAVATGTPSQTNNVPAAAPSQESSQQMLEVLSAKAVSATGVLLHFSDPVILTAADVTDAFMVRDASGAVLAIMRIRITGRDVTFQTAPQHPGKIYEVRIGSIVRGRSSSSGKPIGLRIEKDSILFTGFDGMLAGSPEPALEPPAPDVYSLRLRSAASPDGTYAVIAEWKTPSHAESIAVLSVRQTRDHGRTLSQPETIDPSATSFQFKGIDSGSFGVLIQSLNHRGLPSRGASADLTLRALAQPSGDLSRSGPGLLLALVGTGMVVGWKTGKKRARGGTCKTSGQRTMDNGQ